MTLFFRHMLRLAVAGSLAAVFILTPAPVLSAWDNPNKTPAPFIDIAPDKPVRVLLENRRVQSVDGDIFRYDTGRKVLTIKADSLAVRRFLRDVQAGRRSARAAAILTPERQSPFNTSFIAR